MTTISRTESNFGPLPGRTVLALNEKASALKAAEALARVPANAGAAGSGLEYAFSVQLTPQLWDAAHAVGLARRFIKELRGKRSHEFRAGQDEKVDTEGALGEMLLALVLDKAGAEVAPLVAHKPDSQGLDLHLCGQAFDVKTFGEGRALVCVNVRAHEAKPPAAYVAVKIARGDLADVFVVCAEKVSSWEVVTAIRGRALPPERYYHAARLPVLPELPELVEA